MEEEKMLQIFTTKQDLKDFEEKIDEKFRQRTDEILTVLDQQTTILRRLDEERVFGSERVNRLETRVDKVEIEVKNLQVKTAVI